MRGVGVFGVTGALAVGLLVGRAKADFPAVNVTAALAGEAPDTMAASVATPLEREFSRLTGFRSTTSSSRPGETSITIQFDSSRDLDAASMDVSAAIRKVQPELPHGTEISIRKGDPSDPPILYLALTSQSLPTAAVAEFARSEVVRRISMTPAVSEVSLNGSATARTHIRLDAEAMDAYGLAVDDLESALKEQEALIEHHPESFRNITVAYRNGTAVRLDDIGKLVGSNGGDRYRDRRAVIVTVRQASPQGAAETVANIRKLIPELRKRLPEVDIDAIEYTPDSIFGLPEFASGVSMESRAELQQHAVSILTADANVESVISIVGKQLYVELKKDRRSNADEIAGELRRKLAGLPGVRLHLWSAAKGRRSYTFTGADLEQLTERALRVERKLQSIAGVEDVMNDLRSAVPRVVLKIDDEKARMLGVTADQIKDAFSIADGSDPMFEISGDTATNFAKLKVAGKDGKLLPLSSLAVLATTVGPPVVNHSGPMLSVTFWFQLRPGVDYDKVLEQVKSI